MSTGIRLSTTLLWLECASQVYHQMDQSSGSSKRSGPKGKSSGQVAACCFLCVFLHFSITEKSWLCLDVINTELSRSNKEQKIDVSP